MTRSARSTDRTAYPSIDELTNGGTASVATTDEAATHPRASSDRHRPGRRAPGTGRGRTPVPPRGGSRRHVLDVVGAESPVGCLRPTSRASRRARCASGCRCSSGRPRTPPPGGASTPPPGRWSLPPPSRPTRCSSASRPIDGHRAAGRGRHLGQPRHRRLGEDLVLEGGDAGAPVRVVPDHPAEGDHRATSTAPWPRRRPDRPAAVVPSRRSSRWSGHPEAARRHPLPGQVPRRDAGATARSWRPSYGPHPSGSPDGGRSAPGPGGSVGPVAPASSSSAWGSDVDDRRRGTRPHRLGTRGRSRSGTIRWCRPRRATAVPAD